MAMYGYHSIFYPLFSYSFVYFYSTYGEPIPVKELAERVASYVHLCTLYWWLRFVKYLLVFDLHLCASGSLKIINCYRPFGCGVILGGYDRDGPQLYMIEPSGVSYVSWYFWWIMNKRVRFNLDSDFVSFFFFFCVFSSGFRAS